MKNQSLKSSLDARPELLYMVNSIAKEKSIPIEEVFKALEQAITKVGLTKYGTRYNIDAHVNQSNGEITLFRLWDVVEDIEDVNQQITLEDAQKIKSDAKIGDIIEESVPMFSFDRSTVQIARQIINQRISDIEKDREYEYYKDKVGEIVSGVVKRFNKRGFEVNIGRAEAFLSTNHFGYKERLENGTRIRAIITSVKRENKVHQVTLSRSNVEFIVGLFAQEIPEVYDGTIKIKAIARDPGSRTKVAVISNDASINPISTCIGFKGSRIKPIIDELGGEKIDVVKWHKDPVQFVLNIFDSNDVKKVLINDDKGAITIVVNEESLSSAIGKAGQNIRLASKLLGWKIAVMHEEQEKENAQKEFQAKNEMFIKELDVDNVISQLLIIEGFNTLDDIGNSSPEDLEKIEGFNIDIANEVKLRAQEAIKRRKKLEKERMQELGIAEEILELTNFSMEQIEKLAQNNVKTMEDFAYLSSYDLFDVIGNGVLSKEQADEIILKAREKAFN